MFKRYENEEKKVLQPFDAAEIFGPVCLRVKYTNWVSALAFNACRTYFQTPSVHDVQWNYKNIF